jgi:hypothetical protein
MGPMPNATSLLLNLFNYNNWNSVENIAVMELVLEVR